MVHHFTRVPQSLSRNILLRMTALMLGTSVLVTPLLAAQDEPWREVDIQSDWKRPDYEGQVEYRSFVTIPDSWQGRDITVFLEAADDAREFRFNDEIVAVQGSFPPSYRSGLGETDRFRVPADAIRFGEINQVTIRVFRRASRENFNVAAPAIFAESEAIHLAGTWMRINDRFTNDAAVDEDTANRIRFDRVQSADAVSEIVQRLPDESGPLTPEQALATMETAEGLQVNLALADPDIGQPLSLKFDGRGRMWVVEYLQYPDPAGLTMVSRDKYLRTVYDKVPPPPPNHFRGADRISIHEDTDGDGYYESHSVFVDELNMVSSFAIGRDGVYVLNPPYLLYYADQNQDDVPDDDPEVLLEGFGLEDSHSITNSLRWGPDGWLYATQGSTVTGNVRAYGSEDEIVHTMGQLVWRYHPTTREYEVFAEGGGNAFGLEFDAAGRVYSGHNGGDTRGFHYVQGGYFQKSFGKHGALSNPFTFGYFSWMQHHSAQRFSHTFVIDEGDALPDPFAGRLFAVEPLHSRVMMSDVEPHGSTFKTEDVGHALASSDVWFRPVDIQSGPDGALYVADFYEQRIDHSSHYQGRVHKSSGRIYRVAAAAPGRADFDFATMTHQEVADYLDHPNRWFRQTALRTIYDGTHVPVVPDFYFDKLMASEDASAVNFLWAHAASMQVSPAQWRQSLNHPSPHVRRWAVRLMCDDGYVAPESFDDLLKLAREESDLEVLSQIASSARRLRQPTQRANGQIASNLGLDLCMAMAGHDGIQSDPHLPLLIWWVFEANADSARQEVIAWAGDNSMQELPLAQEFLLSRIMRRFASTGRLVDLESCASLLESMDEPNAIDALLQGFDQAFQGRLMSNIPPRLAAALLQHRGDSIELRLQLGELEALPQAHELLLHAQTPSAEITKILALISHVRDSSSIEVIWQLIDSDRPGPVRLAAIHALRGFADEGIAVRALEHYSKLEPMEQVAVQTLLVSRKAWAAQLLRAIESEQIAIDAIDPQTIDAFSLLVDSTIQSKVAQLFGDASTTQAEDVERRVEHYQLVLADGTGNPYQGRTLYTEHCGRCHKLFDNGGDIGPDLTSFQRNDPFRMLSNVLAPSLEIREGFETSVVVTLDGLTVSGFIADRDPTRLVIKQADGQSITIPDEDIEELLTIPKSVMPEGLLDDLNPQQVRDLFAYLRATQPLPN